jgi:hypothetical protein
VQDDVDKEEPTKARGTHGVGRLYVEESDDAVD